MQLMAHWFDTASQAALPAWLHQRRRLAFSLPQKTQHAGMPASQPHFGLQILPQGLPHKLGQRRSVLVVPLRLADGPAGGRIKSLESRPAQLARLHAPDCPDCMTCALVPGPQQSGKKTSQ